MSMNVSELDLLNAELVKSKNNALAPEEDSLSQLVASKKQSSTWEDLGLGISTERTGLAFATSFAAGITVGLVSGFAKAMRHSVIKKSPALIWNQMLNASSRKSHLYASSITIFTILGHAAYCYKANEDRKHSISALAFGSGVASTVMTLNRMFTSFYWKKSFLKAVSFKDISSVIFFCHNVRT